MAGTAAPGATWLQQQQQQQQTAGVGGRYAVASIESLSSLAAIAAAGDPTSRRPANNRLHRQVAVTAGSDEGVALDVGGSPLAHQPLHDGHQRSGNEHLYEAYNDLHALAQVCEKPFDAPAILVVGHQTDGKSALVEALMGFQFNSVGGGTKTRRPVTLHMKYDAAATQPICSLLNDDLTEQEMGLEELQAFIDGENSRLEGEQLFSNKELVIKVQYRSCPNLTIIDMPGLISAAPGKKNATLQGYSKQVEAMVRAKMEQREYIILALEDSNDWSNATTRRLVMQVDPNLARTVLVSTKFDTKLPQFARAADVETYLHPVIDCAMLGGSPFFTSVPSGRVGTAKDHVFATNEAFREAVAQREVQDTIEAEAKMQRGLDKVERSHVGVGQLRRFLEQLLQRRYLESVPAIVPLLEREARQAAERLEEVTRELVGLGTHGLKDKGRAFVDAFLTKLLVILHGTATAAASQFGETLADEHVHGGAFVDGAGAQLPVPEGLHNAAMRLFGGAQFHRAMTEFRLAVGAIGCPDITREEIVNAGGVEDFHDGVNYMRTACVIAVTKGKETFEPYVHQLGYRLSHVLRRLLPITLHLLHRDGAVPVGHDAFLLRVTTAFHAFIDKVERACKERCLEDLQSTTRYVTWSLHSKSTRSLKAMMAKIKLPEAHPPTSSGKEATSSAAAKDVHTPSSSTQGSHMAELLETTLWNRNLNTASEEVVAALVCQVFEGVRDHIVQQAELKFQCFFLMELVDAFPARLRSHIETAFEEDVDAVFDVGAVRRAMEVKALGLQSEVQQVERLQRKFARIHSTLAQQLAGAAAAERCGTDGLDGLDGPSMLHAGKVKA